MGEIDIQEPFTNMYMRVSMQLLVVFIIHDKLYKGRKTGGSVVEWFRGLDLKSGGPWFKSSTLLLSGFVPLGSPEFKSSTMLCK